ncbi:hypothetical protein ACQCN2_09475 [Brevibacillus ginsengisoli]|uniref:hypothetical protein n=1 Tax=Brevibacillus ginsengisoli TaxID=363854 RepID=UPI003CF0F647
MGDQYLRVLNEEFGEKHISEWLIEQLKKYHKEKYGEEGEVVYLNDSEDEQHDNGKEATRREY